MYTVRFTYIQARDIANLLEQSEPAMRRIEGNSSFYSRLERSIMQEGFRNPILVSAGFCPPNLKCRLPTSMEQNDTVLACYRLGGSRLFMAQKHDLRIPCIVSDFIGRFADCELLTTSDDIASKFKDKPAWITFQPDGVYMDMLDHYHMRTV